MTKDTIISELFHRFRCAKRLLQIDHPTCGCGQPSVGCQKTFGTGLKEVVAPLCEQHWTKEVPPTIWRVRWDEWEDAGDLTYLIEQAEKESE